MEKTQDDPNAIDAGEGSISSSLKKQLELVGDSSESNGKWNITEEKAESMKYMDIDAAISKSFANEVDKSVVKMTKKAKKKMKHEKKAMERKLELDMVVKHDKTNRNADINLGESSFTISKSLSDYISRISDYKFCVKKGFVPNMKVDCILYANDEIARMLFEEMTANQGGFLPAITQVANVGSIPGAVGFSLSMPDAHSGYGFAIGSVLAIDTKDKDAVVVPGGVGFDINCGVRLIRTNLMEEQLKDVKSVLAKELYKSVPVGVGAKSTFRCSKDELDEIMNEGMQFLTKNEYCWPEDAEFCEAHGCIQGTAVGSGLAVQPIRERVELIHSSKVGTLGSGNHYCEVQVVDTIFDEKAANAMGITSVGQVMIMLHCGSRGLGHQVCSDYLQLIEKGKKEIKGKTEEISNDDFGDSLTRSEPGIVVQNPNDRQLTGIKLHSTEGNSYIKAMSAAANFAFVNRSILTSNIRLAFERVMKMSAKKMDMHVVYDVCHNMAKVEKHIVEGTVKELIVHRKGATRAFGPGSSDIPEVYREVGQPVLIGGSMGTSSYVLTGTETAMIETFGSTCHGAGRAMSRSGAMHELRSNQVLRDLRNKGIAVEVAQPSKIAEEAPEAYKDIDAVVGTCHGAGISKLCAKLRPIAVVKG